MQPTPLDYKDFPSSQEIVDGFMKELFLDETGTLV